jgi:phage N-6-adenine-methyltransferase
MSRRLDLNELESGIRTLSDVPSLSQMIREGQQSAERIKRATRNALMEWFAQSERLNIARIHYAFRGTRFTEFADQIGVDRSSAFQLVKLWRHRAKILSQCLDEGRYYGWETCLYWHEPPPRHWSLTHKPDGKSDERRTPTSVFQCYGKECTLDVAATDVNALCAHYFTKKQNGLKQPWYGVVWLNPPYSHLMPWCRKAVEYARAGGRVIALLPAWTDTWFFHECCSLGRITFIRNRLLFPGAPGSHAPFPSIIVEWTPETVQRSADAALDAFLDKRKQPLNRIGNQPTVVAADC